MSGKATNVALLLFTTIGFATGIGVFLAGSPMAHPVVAAHAIAGCSLFALFFWKRPIAARSLRRRLPGLWLLPSVALALLLVGVVTTGILWSTTGLPSYAGYSALTTHVALGAGVIVLLALHAASHWPRARPRDFAGRRALMRSALLAISGAAIWQAAEAGTRAAGLSGARRRFTGSRNAGSSGNDFPASQWLFDNPGPLDREQWRVRVDGHVAVAARLSLSELGTDARDRAVLDCTGGWFAERDWQGVRLSSLLDQAGVLAGARSVVVRSSTGYWRRFSIQEARGAILATHVDGQALDHEHGAPARLVVPGRRGYDWVKWVGDIEVSTASPLLNWPLPIS